MSESLWWFDSFVHRHQASGGVPKTMEPPVAPQTICTTDEKESGRNEESTVEEEDWSALMCMGREGGEGYAKHDRQLITLMSSASSASSSPHTKMELNIASVRQLSPLDMMDLSWGTSDATGNRIWLGAWFFLHSILSSKETIQKYFSAKDDGVAGRKLRVIELGCGSGLVGIAIARFYIQNMERLILTDNSPTVLDLCRQNVTRNLSSDVTAKVQVSPLEWGSLDDIDQDIALKSFDLVVATDVIYDLSALVPLLETTRSLLKVKEGGAGGGGIWILSHVHRADYTPTSTCPTIEEYIIDTAKSYGLYLLSQISAANLLSNSKSPCDQHNRDDDVIVSSDGSKVPIEEMQDAGATIMVFEKRLGF